MNLLMALPNGKEGCKTFGKQSSKAEKETKNVLARGPYGSWDGRGGLEKNKKT